MNKPNLSKLGKTLKSKANKNLPGILTGLGIGGFIVTSVLVGVATPKALDLIEEAEKEKAEGSFDANVELTRFEKVKAGWKPYIPAICTGVLSTASLIGSSKISAKRMTTLAAAYKIAETALSDYKNAVIETIGEKKAKDVKRKVNENKIKANPVEESKVYIAGNGKSLFCEPITMRYFEHDYESIRKIVNDLNEHMINFDYISLNTLFDRLGLETTAIGEQLGWNISREGQILINVEPHVTEDKKPCLMLTYDVEPTYNFDKFAL